MSEERRDNRRILVGADHTIRFLAKGHAFRNVRITNLSMGGCFATVREGDAGVFPKGTILEQFSFEHPDLPQSPFVAQVTFTLGGDPKQPRLDFMGLGIQFLQPPEDIRQGLAHFVDRHL